MDEYDASDRQDVKDAEKAARQALRQDLDAMADIMRSSSGRRWMFRKLALCHVYTTTFNGNALQSAFLEGERNIGLMLHSEIMTACPDDFLLMIKENNERDISDDIARRNRKSARDGTNGHDTSNLVDYTEPLDGAGAED